MIYVHKNDIYYQVFFEGGSDTRRITNTGVPDIVFNGIPDWVYEEEVLGSPVAFWISPDGRHLAFATFNDTNVRDIVISKYGSPGNSRDQYPNEIRIKYPKAGTTNPFVSLSVIDLHDPSSKLIDLPPPVDVVGADNVLYTANWRRDGEIVATWTNRVQNKAQLVL